MRCPPADRWAELDRLPAVEREPMVAHAAGCLACEAHRARVAEVRRTLHDLGRTPAPELSWDLLGARLHWTISSELKRREREAEARGGRLRGLARRFRPWLFVGGAAAAAGVVGALYLRRPTASPRPPQPNLLAAGPESRAPVAARPPAPVSGEAVVTLVQGEARLDAAPLFLESAVRSGMTIHTTAGRVGLQFGERSAFVVEKDTDLELVRVDDAVVELRVHRGRVGVDLIRRRPDQRFAILAGTRAVEVRGTAFRVSQDDDALDVAVARGLVVVVEGSDRVEVPAGARLAVPAGRRLAGLLPRTIAEREATELASAVRVPIVPSWTGAPEARARSAILRVAAGPRARVKIDGVEVGIGTLSVRAPAGRYLVEVGGTRQWVDLEAGTVATTRLEATPRSERPAQLDQQLVAHKGELGQCAPYKQDLEFHAELEVELRVGADGAVNYVTLVKGSGYRDVETCVLDRIRSSFTFPSGTATTVRKKIRL